VESRVPTATYRVQLTGEFGFRQCAAVLPYLSSLGISTLYCSPVLQARAGSTHGYDTVDPTSLSPELGGAEAWADMLCEARRHGLTVLLDIVPNHMAATTENPWWRDVLEHGRVSPYADVFDIDWEPAATRLRNRILLPVLTTTLPEAISEGRLTIDLAESGLVCRYGTLELPLNVRSYRLILAPLLQLHPGTVPDRVIRLIRALPALTDVGDMPGADPDLQYVLRTQLKAGLLDLFSAPPASAPAGRSTSYALVRDMVRQLPAQQINRLLREQCYVLEHWRQGRLNVNYRRFFDINDLVGVRMDDEQVFERTHALLRELAASGVVCGFRVDHIDGLRQPLSYLKRLRAIEASTSVDNTRYAPYVVVEKILSGDEALPADWPVDGTTGYDFLNEAFGLSVAPSGLSDIQQHHGQATEIRTTRPSLTHDNKRMVLTQLFRADLSRLARRLAPVALWLYPSSDISSHQLEGALTDATAALSVYRTYYSGAGELADADRRYIESALDRARKQPNALKSAPAFDVVRRALTLDIPKDAPMYVRTDIREHLLRWQQLSGAAMAKGFEDTTLYQDSVLLALNDVGGGHSLHGTSLPHFHAWNAERLRRWPHTMNCTSTHDTKRGEDVRARLAVLSEIPGEWSAAVDSWLASLKNDEASARLIQRIDSAIHLFLLQTIVGAWPETTDMCAYAGRLVEYMIKVSREAKTHSSWLEPKEDYERALAELIGFMLKGEGARRFHECFDPIITAVRFHGLVNSVAQVLLKATCPGLPDFYQGTELMDLSLVDPDNRRPVDYRVRESLLREVTARSLDRLPMVSELVTNWPDARAKLYVTARALHLRRAHVDVFGKGTYTPLHTDPTRQDQICAFMRSHECTCIVIVVPLRSRTLAGNGRLPLGESAWSTEAIALPPGSPQSFENVFTGERVPAADGQLPLSQLFKSFPVALLVGTRAVREDRR